MKWIVSDEGVKYEIETDMPATIVIGNRECIVQAGKNTFWS